MQRRLSTFQVIIMAAVMLADAFCAGNRAIQAQAVRNGRLVFVSRRSQPPRTDVFAINVDGSQQTSLTRSTQPVFDPAWSPAGKRIAFTIMDQPVPGKLPASGIFVMNADGSERKSLPLSRRLLVFAPAWSPDGRRIAFSSWETAPGKGPTNYIYVMDSDGKNRKRLGEGMVPVWAPLGKQILYTKVGTKVEPKVGTRSSAAPKLCSMNADGSNVKTLASNAALGAWSPDGTQIAYVGTSAGEQSDIYVMNAGGSKKRQLTKSKNQELGPQWSEDGKRIFFNRISIPPAGKSSGSAIYVMDANGKNLKPVTKNATFDFMGNGMSFLLYPAFVKSYYRAYKGATNR